VEQANDRLVARRQQGKGLHWSGETSDALAALRTLKQNQEWERYWQPPATQPALFAAAAYPTTCARIRKWRGNEESRGHVGPRLQRAGNRARTGDIQLGK
jgi:hypothetical protein